MKNQITPTTKQFIEDELYKLCAGNDTRDIIPEYSYNSQWEASDIIQVLIQACIENTSVEDVCTTYKGPSADTIHRRVNELQFVQIEQIINLWLREIVSRLRFHQNTKITLSIDDHFLPYYGRTDHDWITGSKAHRATHYGVMFTVVSITTGTIRCPVYVKLLTKDLRAHAEIVIGQVMDELQQWLTVKRVLMDRWFCQDAVVELLEHRNLEFIIAAPMRGQFKRKVQEFLEIISQPAITDGVEVANHDELGRWACQHQLETLDLPHVRMKRGGQYVRFVARFGSHWEHLRSPIQKRGYHLALYVTNCNLTPHEITKTYGVRWLIETDLRCIGEFKAYSNARQGAIRFFLFGLATVCDALWMVVATLLNRTLPTVPITVTEESQFAIYQHDPILMIAKAFKRTLQRLTCQYLVIRGGDT